MNSINLFHICIICISHFIGDFVLQTRKQALNKSSNWRHLTSHVFTYSLFLLAVLGFVFWDNIYATFSYVFFNYGCHFFTDAITSRWSSKFYKQAQSINDSDPMRDFWLVIGFDQLIHHLTLILSYYFIIVPHLNK